MSCSAKKSRNEREFELFCQNCMNLSEESEEMVILTDHRLVTLSDGLEDDTPQHRITHFSIHDSDRRFCWFDSKPIEEGYELFLCGYVQPIVSDSDSEFIQSMDSNEGKIMAKMIGPLQEWWFAGFDGGQHMIIGVESEFASYILCEPHSDYSHLFIKSTKNMFLTKLIIECLLKNPDSSYENLIQTIEESQQNFCEESLINFSPFIVQQIKSFDSAAEEDENLLSQTSAFKTLLQLSGVSANISKNMNPSKTRSHVRPIARIDSRRVSNSDTLTCSTSLVSVFFDSVFKDVIECESNCSEKSNEFKDKSNKKLSERLTNDTNKKINWIGDTLYKERFARTQYYSSVRIDENTYSLGEFVLFRESDETLKLGKIMFMFDTIDKQMFCHFHYFCFGRDTILAETAPSFAVFMTNQCNNIEIEKIEDRVNVILSDTIDSEYQQNNSNQYFCSKLYHKKSGRFEDLPKEVFDCDLKCINCLITERREAEKRPQLEEKISEDSDSINKYKKLIYENQSYSVGDCALFSSDAFPINYFNYENCHQMCDNKSEEYDQNLFPERYRKGFTDYIKGINSDLPKTLNIGLIIQIFKKKSDSNEETKLLVNIFYRPQNIFENYSDFRFCDLNLLFWSNHEFVVNVETIRGKCQVIYSQKSIETNFYIETKLFYFKQFYNFETKIICEVNEDVINRFISSDDRKDTTRDSQNKLNVLDLFAGCGGLSYGFHSLGLISKLWAIEKDCSALNSFKANFKSALVFQEDVNHFLDQLIKGVKFDKNGQKFPIKGEIDLILGGPPCQGFSGMNRFSSRHYSMFKNSLVVSFLSFIDYYRPKYLIFENVRNLALFKNSMILKLMMSCLLTMGYQCQFAILQSGCYGLPQTRRRTVIMGAFSGIPLPSFPQMTHIFSRRQCQLSITIDDKKYSAFNKKSYAHFRSITVYDAISDLPELGEDYALNKIRNYLTNDLTHYQKLMRSDGREQLFDHFCKELSELCRLRIKYIPKSPASDWRDLPNISLTLSDGTVIPKLEYNYKDLKSGRSSYASPSNLMRGVCVCAEGLECDVNECRQENTLIPWCLVHTANRQYQWSGLYGRLIFNGYFPTTVTNPEPISKQGRVLHPTQDRIISVRESARSQGFPDCFQFCGTVSEKYRQIGNAVPIPLSYALSRQFFDIL